ncbi:hypothetical protein [Nocardioides korecus]
MAPVSTPVGDAARSNRTASIAARGTISPLTDHVDPAVGSFWRLPRVGWVYVAVVTTLAAVSTFSDALSAYAVLLIATLPTGLATKVANLMMGLPYRWVTPS